MKPPSLPPPGSQRRIGEFLSAHLPAKCFEDLKIPLYVSATDVEHGCEKDQDLVEFARDGDMLIIDAMYTEDEYIGNKGPPRIGWGHSTWQEGIRLCEAAGAHRLVAFHHDPEHDDEALDSIAAEMEARREGSVVAREGLVIDL